MGLERLDMKGKCMKVRRFGGGEEGIGEVVSFCKINVVLWIRRYNIGFE